MVSDAIVQTKVDTVNVNNGMGACDGNTACDAIVVNNDPGTGTTINTGARAHLPASRLAARSDPRAAVVCKGRRRPPARALHREMVLDDRGHRRRQPGQPF